MSFLAFFGLKKAAAIEVGADAPAVTAVDDEGKSVRFADFYQKGITLVYFYPKAGTSGCTAEACSFRDAYDKLQAQGLQIIGVSHDSITTLDNDIKRTLEPRTASPQARLKVIGKHPLGERVAFGECPPYLLWRMRDGYFSSDDVAHG